MTRTTTQQHFARQEPTSRFAADRRMRSQSSELDLPICEQQKGYEGLRAKQETFNHVSINLEKFFIDSYRFKGLED